MLFVMGYYRFIFGNFIVRFNKFVFNFLEEGGKIIFFVEL